MDAFLFFPLMGIIVIVIIPLLIGIMVYRDAKSRGMDALVWALVAMLIPGFIGLIIYLIMRKDFGNLRCAKCNSLVRADFLACPYCGNDLKGRCPNCNRPVEPDYKICPNCAHALTPMEGAGTYQASRKSDNTLVILLIAAVLIPVIIVGGLFAATFMYSSNSGQDLSPVFQEEEMVITRSILDDQKHIDDVTRTAIEGVVDSAVDKFHLLFQDDGTGATYLAFKNEERQYYYLDLLVTDQEIHEIRISSVWGYDKAVIPEYVILDLGMTLSDDVEIYLDDVRVLNMQGSDLQVD